MHGQQNIKIYLHCFQICIAASYTEIFDADPGPVTLIFSDNFILHSVIN